MKAPSPYPGLRPFREDESALFFGRDRQTVALAERVTTRPLVALVGASGSGKSSLINAGLLPALASGLYDTGGGGWTVLRLQPGPNPLASLAQGLVRVVAPGEDPLALEGRLRQSRHTLRSLLGAPGERPPVLVVVDQFEEVFRYRRTLRGTEGWQDDVEHFTGLLIEAARGADSPAQVLLALRGEFVASCAEIAGLAELINDSVFLLPPLDQSAVREIVAAPLAVVGADVDIDVVVAFQRAAETGATLPVLEHALMRLWNHTIAGTPEGAPPRLTLRAFEAVGGEAGVLGTLDLHGQELLPPRGSPELVAIEKVFRRLCFTNSNGVRVRNPVPVAQLARVLGWNVAPEEVRGGTREVAARLEALLRPFLDAEFLQENPPNVPLTLTTVIDVSHESLLRGWRQLDLWLNQEAADTNFFRRLTEHAVDEQLQRADLLDGPMLPRAEDFVRRLTPFVVWAERLPTAGSVEQAALVEQLVARSRAEADRAVEEAKRRVEEEAALKVRVARLEAERRLAEERERFTREYTTAEAQRAAAQSTMRTRWLTAVAVVLLGLALGFGSFSFNVLTTQRTAVKSLETERDRLQQRVTASAAEITRLQADAEAQRLAWEQARDEAARANQEKNVAKEQYEAAEKARAHNAAALKKAFEAKSEEAEQLSATSVSLYNTYSDSAAKAAALEATSEQERKVLEARVAALDQQRAALVDQTASLSASVAALTSQVDELSRANAALQQLQAGAQARALTAQQKLDEVAGQCPEVVVPAGGSGP